MAKNSHISDDWSFRYTDQFFFHVDGILTYDTNTGTAPSLDQYVKGGTSGAIGRVIGGSDLGGTNATGTLTLTAVSGKFQNNEAITVLDELDFDTVTNGGFKEGDVLTGPTTEQFTVDRIEYNYGTVSGEGICFGSIDTAGFTDGEAINDATPQQVATVNTGAETDNSALFTGALVNSTNGLIPPGTANENDSGIIHYDAGTIDIPVEAVVADATTGGIGIVHSVYGTTTTGSLRLVDLDETGGSFTNDNGLNINEVVFYNNLQSGKVFSEGDIIEATAGGRARVLAVIDDGDNTGKLITASREGTFTATNDLDVNGVKIAEVENATTILAAATLNLPNGIRFEQLEEDGGIYGGDQSLNIVRRSNELYTHGQSEAAQLNQMDDPEMFSAQVRDGQYTIINGWQTLTRCMQFVSTGSWQDENNNNVWANPQTILSGPLVTSRGFFYDSSEPTPMPKIYIEQDGAKITPYWIEGTMDALVLTKTSYDTRYINPSVDTLGQLIDGGNTIYRVRPYGYLYAIFVPTANSGVITVPLKFAADGDNGTGEKRVTYTGVGGFTIGEEVRGSTGGRAIVVAEDTGADTLDVNYLTAAALSGTITGEVSASTATFSSESNLVAGYSTDIREMVVNTKIAGGTTASGPWTPGELLTQAVTGATGYLMIDDDADDLYVQKVNTIAFDTTNTITGGTSGATYSGTFTLTTNQTTLLADLGEGSGELSFTGLIATDITGASASLIQEVYEWTKYITRDISTTNIQDAGGATTATTPGFFFRYLNSTYLEVEGAPIGTFAGGKQTLAQGWFIVKEDLAPADIQNFFLRDNAGTSLTPPNLQSIVVNLEVGDSITVFRSQGAGQENILRTEFDVGTVGSGNNQAADSTILVGANTRTVGPLPADVPDSGVLWVEDPGSAGEYLTFPYSSVDRTTNIFTLASGTIGDVTGAADLVLDDNVFVSPISKVATAAQESNSLQYIGDIPLFYRYRKLGKQPQRGVATFGNTGVTISPTSLTDGIADVV